MYVEDTIAAIATAHGAAGIGVIRISGPLVPHIAARIFTRSRAAELWESHRLYHGHVHTPDARVLDEGLAVWMRAPHSFTGEDVLELHCHGSPVALRTVLSAVLACGARLAAPGEFTKRAFLNGRLDLAQAEAVIDLVSARTTAGAHLAAEQLRGRLSNHLGDVRAALIHAKALLEAQIDFSDEDIQVNADDVRGAIDPCVRSIQALIESYRHGKVVRDGLRVTIVGRPNVGKSSLLNALLGEERAIVTEVPGTTRDVIDETADFDGVPVILSDTAGLRAVAGDAIERIGIQRTHARIDEADILLTVLDSSQPLTANDRRILEISAGAPRVIALNKADLPHRMSPGDIGSAANGWPTVSVSATQHIGLAALRSAVLQVAGHRPLEWSSLVLTSLRHAAALTQALESLRLAEESITQGRPPDLVAVDVQDAIDHIGELTGAVTTDDVLDRIFRAFCIGK